MLLAAGPSASADEAGSVPGSRGNAVAELARKVVLLLSETPSLVTQAQVDRMAGDPWTLEPATAARLRLFPAKLRLQLYTAIASNMGTLNVIPESSGAPVPTGPDAAASVIQVGEAATRDIVARLVDTIGGYFSAEEMVDLGVYLLSKQSFFPKDRAGWNRLKGHIVSNQLLLALGAAMAFAVADKGFIKSSGTLVAMNGDRLRIGWYASARDLGISWQPTFNAGLRFKSTHLEVLGGWIKHVRPAADSEISALELAIRETWLKGLVQRTGWEMATTGAARYAVRHGDPERQGSLSARVDLFAKRKDVFTQEALNLLVGMSFSADFMRKYSAQASLGLENAEQGLSGILALSAVGEEGKLPDYRAQFVVGGALGADSKRLEGEMYRRGSRLRDALEEFERREAEYRAVEARLDRFGTGLDSAAQEAALLRELRYWETWRARRRILLKRRLDDYLYARRNYFLSQGKKLSTLRPGDGTVPPEIIAQVLAKLGT